MLLWVSLLAGLLLLGAAIALIVAMFRAERRARRNLYRSLGLAEETVEILMTRDEDVISGLALVRLSTPAGELHAGEPDPPPPAAEALPHRLQPTLRLVHPVTGETQPPAPPRRQPGSGERL